MSSVLISLYTQTHSHYGTLAGMYQGMCCLSRLLYTVSSQTMPYPTKWKVTKQNKHPTLHWDSYYKLVYQRPMCIVLHKKSSAKQKHVCILYLVTLTHLDKPCLAASAGHQTVPYGKAHPYRLTRPLFIQRRPFICFVIVRKLLLQIADKMQLLITET